MLLDIATAPMGNSKKWKNKKINWSDFVEIISKPYHTKETAIEFFRMDKDEQAAVKDVGAYFGGYIRSGRRLKTNILHRQLLTLDIDFAGEYFWDDFTLNYSCTAVVHGTHKWSAENPRLRLLIPLDREVSSDEYTAISRRVAGNLGINVFDPTTFDVNRFMYWQSTPCDVEYHVKIQDGGFLSADLTLSEYVDWTDISEHPRTVEEKQKDRKIVGNAENPTEKKGIIGYFCKTYGIKEAIDKFIPESYEQSEADPNRFTYKGGTTHGGAVVYDDLFLYSHHSTDPCCNTLVNAYDLVMTHLFEGHTDTARTKKMTDLILSDEDVKLTIASDRIGAVEDFDGIVEEDDEDKEPINLEWVKKLEVDRAGKYLPTANNFANIFKNDSRLKNIFKYNLFSNRVYAVNSPAWRKIKKPEPMTNVDYAGLRTYIERIYGIASPQKVDDALIMEASKSRYHPIKDYLSGITWDGMDRISELFPFWLGADDNEYTRDVAKQFLRGAVSRIYEAGNKFDYVLTFVGQQGVGKSVLAAKLGGEWFSDTLMSIKGKEGLEALQGYWIVEMAELSSLKKSDLESQKHYIAKTKDSFRPAYGRVVEDFPRQNVFIATTNDYTFLKDMTGNRRFLPVVANLDRAVMHPYKMTKDYVNQIWGQALYIYQNHSYEDIANLAVVQEEFLEIDPRTAEIARYLEIAIPKDFYDLALAERVMYYAMSEHKDLKHKEYQRDTISVIEVFVECLGGDILKMTRQDARTIKEILNNVGWETSRNPRVVKGYGSQRVHLRPIKIR